MCRRRAFMRLGALLTEQAGLILADLSQNNVRRLSIEMTRYPYE